LQSQIPLPRLLEALAGGDETALDAVVASLYDELRLLPRRRRRSWHGDHTLDTTALVHETYLKEALGGEVSFGSALPHHHLADPDRRVGRRRRAPTQRRAPTH
jgi:hypothetical protein